MLDKCRHCVQYVEGGVRFSCIQRVRMHVRMYVDVRSSDAVPQHIPPANLRVNAAI